MIAIVTARGGSKGLPRKNILPLCGMPLIGYTIEAAGQCSDIDRIIVSTDDQEIADVARSYGAEIPFMRPAHLASDTASSRDVLLHTLGFLREQGTSAENFCLLQPTSPLRNANDVMNAIGLFRDKQAGSVLSVVEYEHPIQWAVRLDETGRMVPREKKMGRMRQKAQVYFRPNGAIYVFNTAFFDSSETYFGPDSYAYVMPRERSVDIDTRFDFLLAETLIKCRGDMIHD